MAMTKRFHRQQTSRSPEDWTPVHSDLSASQSSLTRRERRDAILARAMARRIGGESLESDEGESSLVSQVSFISFPRWLEEIFLNIDCNC